MNKRILVIYKNDKSPINLTKNILIFLNKLNKDNSYYFLSLDKPNNLKKYIKKNNLQKSFDQFEKSLARYEYDWLLSIWSKKIFDKSFLAKFKHNLNLHPSYLPYNRGKDPYCWSIYNNTPIGVTIHKMTAQIDKGDIYLRKKIHLNFPYSAYKVYTQSLLEIKKLFTNNWQKIKDGKIKPKKISYKNKKLNLRKDYFVHTHLNLDENTIFNNNIKKFIYKSLSCDFKNLNSLKVKLNKEKYNLKIILKKIKF